MQYSKRELLNVRLSKAALDLKGENSTSKADLLTLTQGDSNITYH